MANLLQTGPLDNSSDSSEANRYNATGLAKRRRGCMEDLLGAPAINYYPGTRFVITCVGGEVFARLIFLFQALAKAEFQWLL